MRDRFIIAAAGAMVLSSVSTATMAQETRPPGQECPVDTTKDASTGETRTGVQVCGGKGSGSVGFTVKGSEVEHFLKYPFGQSDASVAKQIGGAVHHFFSKL